MKEIKLCGKLREKRNIKITEFWLFIVFMEPDFYSAREGCKYSEMQIAFVQLLGLIDKMKRQRKPSRTESFMRAKNKKSERTA